MIFGINRLELPHKKAGCDMDKLEEYQRWQNNLARVRFPRWKGSQNSLYLGRRIFDEDYYR